MRPRYAAVLAANLLVLGILIYVFYVLRSRYYLIVVLPPKTIVQLGPFDTKFRCEVVRSGLPELTVGGGRLEEKDRGEMLKFMACVPSR
jgi:hypothetical protein